MAATPAHLPGRQRPRGRAGRPAHPGRLRARRARPALHRVTSSSGDPVAGALALGAVLAALARTAPDLPRRAGAGRQPPAGAHRRADRAAQPAARCSRRWPPPTSASPPARRSPSSCSTSTGSRRSTTRSATPSAMRCCPRSGPRLRGELRADDLLARLGGDEFVVLAEDLDADGRARLAARLRAQLQRPFGFGGMGLDRRRQHRRRASARTHVAQRRRAAPAGRPGHVLGEVRPHRRRGLRRGARRARPAPARGRRPAAPRPRATTSWCCTTSRSWRSRPARSTASRRWSAGSTPTRGLLYPDPFIDLAESAGLMAQLTGRVIEMALAQCRAWSDRGPPAHRRGQRQPVQPGRRGLPDQVPALLPRLRAAGAAPRPRGDREPADGGPRARRARAPPAARRRRRRRHRRLRHRLLEPRLPGVRCR